MNELVSNLQIGDKIGAGHFGTVYRGHDDVHGLVAVKVITKEPKETDDEWQQRKAGMLKEAQTLKKAQHRNVVEVYHLVERRSDDAILYVMQYCDGGALQKPFETGPVNLSEVRDVATDITQGLGILHARGMIHRDIKPGNLLRHEGIAKLGDFGLVTDDLVLGYGAIAGYTDHIAPEVWAGVGTSAKSDIWALGMTLYRLLHGFAWYSESPRPAVLVQQGGFADKLVWLPHVPKKWRRFIRGMLRDDPADRYQSTQQVLAALADLPVEPDWSCEVHPDLVLWTRMVGLRMLHVVWHRHSARRHEWEAWSDPIGNGRRRSLGTSGGVVGCRKAVQGLEAFFG